jgi:CubicO group peptidase (beta-lactamase class C family)
MRLFVPDAAHTQPATRMFLPVPNSLFSYQIQQKKMKKFLNFAQNHTFEFLAQTFYNLMSRNGGAIFCLLLCAAMVQAQPYISRHNLTSAQYQTEVAKWTSAPYHYRLTQVSGYSDGGQDRYAALFEKETGPAYTARHNMTPAQYQNEVNTLKAQGYRPVQVSGFPSGGDCKYAAIFFKEANPPQAVAKHGLTSAQYQDEYDKWKGLGYKLTDISAYTVGGVDFYAAIWEKIAGPDRYCRHGMTSAQYQDEVELRASQGFRLHKVSGYSVANQPRFAAIWLKTTGPALAARHAISGAQNYQDEVERLYYLGYRPGWINGYTVNNQDYFAGTWTCADPFKSSELKKVDDLVKQYMDDNDVPGISIALAKDGKLMFAKTYGFANQETGERVAPRHLFRIASVSKPITATAIMKLEQNNVLELTDKVFGAGAILGTTYGSNNYTNNLKNINIDHLLTHHAGGWDQEDDPILQDQSWSMTKYINETLDNDALVNAPGDAYDYSNFGYALLGRVIEKKTGKTYEDWVQDNILQPCGITAMRIGGSTLADRKPNEVKYYGNNAYFYNIPRMDAHGGWIASPIDLVRFLVHVDQSATVPDILSGTTQTKMFNPSPKNNTYCRGWSRVVGSESRWHNGALPSTLSEMKRTSDGFCIAILMNTRPGVGKDVNGGAMGTLLGNIKNAITYWPDHDLF